MEDMILIYADGEKYLIPADMIYEPFPETVSENLTLAMPENG